LVRVHHRCDRRATRQNNEMKLTVEKIAAERRVLLPDCAAPPDPSMRQDPFLPLAAVDAICGISDKLLKIILIQELLPSGTFCRKWPDKRKASEMPKTRRRLKRLLAATAT
jgi:hypothetical protein